MDGQDVFPPLVAHWPLAGDAEDVVGGLNGRAQNITFGPGPAGSAQGAAIFDGRRSVIEVADSNRLHLGKRDFSVSVWVKCQTPMRGVFGDVLGKFDPSGAAASTSTSRAARPPIAGCRTRGTCILG